MGKRIPMNSGDEVDDLGNWLHYVKKYRPGRRAASKRRYRRRERAVGKARCRTEVSDV